MASSENVLVVVTLIIFCGIYVPLSTYQIWQLYHSAYRKDNPMKSLLKRHTNLSIVCCIAYCIQFVDLSLWSLAFTNWFSEQTKDSIIFISQFIHLLMQFIFAFTIVLRFWLLHFSIKYEMILFNHNWKVIINPDYVVQEKRTNSYPSAPYPANNGGYDHKSNTKWILSNTKRWGNLRFCLKTVGVGFVILFCAICAAQILHTFYDEQAFQFLRIISSMITYGIFLLIWTIILAIYCRTPDFYDHIYIKQELSHLFHILVGFFFVYIVFAVLFGFSNDDIYNDGYFPEVLLLFHCVALGNLIAIHVFTYLPLRNLQKFHESEYLPNQKQSCFSLIANKVSYNLTSSSIVGSTDIFVTANHAKQVKLEDVLRDNSGFGAFMKVYCVYILYNSVAVLVHELTSIWRMSSVQRHF